jgi:hypothetical protein
MNQKIALTLSGMSALFFTSCATKMSTDKNAPTGPLSATVTLKETQAAYWASAKGGKGTILYRGMTHSFTMQSIGFGGTGLQSISATGEVYNLTDLNDFSGEYNGLRTGLTLLKGKMRAKLKNEKGVVLYLTGKTTGLASSTGADKITIKMD